MLAHAHRTLTGTGQYVDVSCQDAVARALANAPQSYVLDGGIIKRQGSYRQTGSTTYMRITWPCRDGFVNFQFSGGAGAGASVNNFVQWMAEAGMGDAYLESLDFTQLGYGTITLEMLERIVPVVERFMRSHSKQELFDGAGGAAHPAVSGGHTAGYLRQPPVGGTRLLSAGAARRV